MNLNILNVGFLGASSGFPFYTSLYESFNPLTTLNKSHFVEWCSGAALRSIWTVTTEFGTFTVSMNNSIDGGINLLSSTGGNQGGYIDFNGIHHYNNSSSTHIAVWERVGSFQAVCGLWSNVSEADVAYWRDSPSSDTFKSLVTTGSSTQTVTASTVNMDTSYHLYKMVLGVSNVVGTIDGANTTTSTTNLPTAKLQPVFKTTTNITPAAQANMKYLEVYNT